MLFFRMSRHSILYSREQENKHSPRQESEHVLLSFSHESKFWFFFTDGYWKEHIHQVDNRIPNARSCVALFHEDLSSGMAAGTGADFRFTAVHSHSPWFVWCLLGADSLIKKEWEETTSPASLCLWCWSQSLQFFQGCGYSSNLQFWLGYWGIGNV